MRFLIFLQFGRRCLFIFGQVVVKPWWFVQLKAARKLLIAQRPTPLDASDRNPHLTENISARFWSSVPFCSRLHQVFQRQSLKQADVFFTDHVMVLTWAVYKYWDEFAFWFVVGWFRCVGYCHRDLPILRLSHCSAHIMTNKIRSQLQLHLNWSAVMSVIQRPTCLNVLRKKIY